MELCIHEKYKKISENSINYIYIYISLIQYVIQRVQYSFVLLQAVDYYFCNIGWLPSFYCSINLRILWWLNSVSGTINNEWNTWKVEFSFSFFFLLNHRTQIECYWQVKIHIALVELMPSSHKIGARLNWGNLKKAAAPFDLMKINIRIFFMQIFYL